VIVMMFSSLWFFNRDYKKYAPSIHYIDFTLVKDIFDLGVKFFLIQIAVIIIFQTSNIIITQLCGPQDVTVYNIAYKYFGVMTMGFSIILAPFWSAYTEAQALNDFGWMNNALKKLKTAWIALACGAIILLLFSPFTYKLWIGSRVEIPLSVSTVVFVYVIIFNWCAIFSQILAGLGKIKLTLYLAIAGCLVNIPLSIFLGKKWGIVGVVLSSVILSINAGIWSPIQVKMILNKKAKGIWNQ
jgi:O-antigen/teichoic acid export membrane protein